MPLWLMAALALGTSAVRVGTRFVASEEALAHLNYKHRIVETDEEGAVITRCQSGKPCRLIRNHFTDSWEGKGRARIALTPHSEYVAEIDHGSMIRSTMSATMRELFSISVHHKLLLKLPC